MSFEEAFTKQARDEADAARFVWWFGAWNGDYTDLYETGLRENWALNKWRTAIDEAMQAFDQAEDADINLTLRASIEAGRREGRTDAT